MDKDSDRDEVDDEFRHKRHNLMRRFPSTSKVETIVTEDEKLRRAQPDKPVHKPRDSILSWSSEFRNFEGIINWAFLLLSIGGFRLFLENFNKYGVRVDPTTWLSSIFGYENGDEYSTLFLLMYINVPLCTALAVEKMLSRGWISWTVCKKVHVCNIASVLIIPVYVINFKYDHFGPAAAIFSCGAYSIVFLKLWSYAQVNYWCRKAVHARPTKHPFTRNAHASLVDLARPPTSRPGPFNSKRIRLTSTRDIVSYPDNLTLKDMYYFWLAPTLCYELNFPRSGRIRKTFLLRRGLEVIVGLNLALALAQQWIIPSVVNSLIPISNMELSLAVERILKLAFPNHLLWLTLFYLIFHSFLNTMGEILSFADRNFYSDWWNANDVIAFWKSWNLPVHRWAVRHLYKPILSSGYSTTFASFGVFLVSALLHEYLLSVPLRMFKYYAFLGMIFQVPLMFISKEAKDRIGPRAGNLVVWMSLILGQPLAMMMYYHDFVVAHYGSELISTFGKLDK